jgi:DNA-binding winged helix-turn-helix (wHTH) protein
MPEGKTISEDKQKRLNSFRSDEFVIDEDSKSARYNSESVILSDMQMKVLIFLHRTAPGVRSRSEILEAVWGDRLGSANDNVGELRTNLSPLGLTIENFPRIGYGIAVAAEFDDDNTQDKPHQILRNSGRDLAPASSETAPAPDPVPMNEDIRWKDFVLMVSCPDENAIAFAAHCGALDRRTIGSVVEVFGHPYLENNLPLEQTGWATNEVFWIDGGALDVSDISTDKRITTEFAASELARQRAGLGSALQGDNNPKFTISDSSTPFADLTNLSIVLKKTDYFTIRRVRPAISTFPELRREFGHIIPNKNRLPQGASITFSAIFHGGDILAIYRDRNTFPFPETWSFSGEEQLDASDMEWTAAERMTMAMLRTAQEEIFPLARISSKTERLAVLSLFRAYIKSMRVWSVFLEEPTATYSFFCLYELNLTVDEYSGVVRTMVQRGMGQPSREGKYYSVKLSDIPGLLQDRVISARPIFGGRSSQITSEELHPTSRYRLVRIIDHLHRQLTA